MYFEGRLFGLYLSFIEKSVKFQEREKPGSQIIVPMTTSQILNKFKNGMYTTLKLP